MNSPCAVSALLSSTVREVAAWPRSRPELLRRPGADGRGIDPRLPGALDPTGRRTYARVHPTDDLQGACSTRSRAPTARAAPPSIRLRRTRIDGGLIGSFSFDANGDISESPVTILRPRTAGTAGTREGTEGAEGARVERVVRPTARLVG